MPAWRKRGASRSIASYSPSATKSVEPRAEDRRPPDERAKVRHPDELAGAFRISADERDPQARRIQTRFVTLACERSSVSLVRPARGRRRRDTTCASARRRRSRAFRTHGVARFASTICDRAIRVRDDRGPVAHRIRELEHERDRVDAVVRRKGGAQVFQCSSVSSLASSKRPTAAMTGTADSSVSVRWSGSSICGRSSSRLSAQCSGLVEAPADRTQARLRTPSAYDRSSEVVERLREARRLLQDIVRNLAGIGVRPCEQRLRTRSALGLGQLERAIRPTRRPAPVSGVSSTFPIGSTSGTRAGCKPRRAPRRRKRAVERAMHRRPEGLAVVAKRLDAADLRQQQSRARARRR